MNVKIKNLQSDILELISAAAIAGDVDRTLKLSALSAQVKELLTACTKIEFEFQEIERRVSLLREGANISENDGIADEDGEIIENGVQRERAQLQIQIDWGMNGFPYKKEVICEKMATNSMVRLFGRLYEVLGNRVLEQGSGFRISRGPILSKSPSTDYINSSTNTLYQHKKLGKTGFYVLTHSSNEEKVKVLQQFLSSLNLKVGSFKVELIKP